MTAGFDWFDLLLALSLVGVALRSLFAGDLFQAVVLYIVLGLLLAIAWCRLEAVDVALAEAAIGAGLTGALLLNTLSSSRHWDDAPDSAPAALGRQRPQRAAQAVRWLTRAAFSLAVAIVCVWLLRLVVPVAPTVDPGIAASVLAAENLHASGVSNPVTAVLLNFRAYDTLLEVAVLLAAVAVVLPLTAKGEARVVEPPVGPVLRAFVSILIPVALLVAAYILWLGTKAPGGAFQAAAMLAAAAVLAIVSGGRAPSVARPLSRLVLVAGPALFILAALAGMPHGRFLEYPERASGALIMLIETGLTLSISLVLVMLFGASGSPGAAPGGAHGRHENHL